jgi:hypothetical protein
MVRVKGVQAWEGRTRALKHTNQLSRINVWAGYFVRKKSKVVAAQCSIEHLVSAVERHLTFGLQLDVPTFFPQFPCIDSAGSRQPQCDAIVA